MSTNNPSTGTPQKMRNVFGIIMILIYLGMGVLCFINFFGFPQWLRYVAGILFTLYGIWRAYRQFRHVDETDE